MDSEGLDAILMAAKCNDEDGIEGGSNDMEFLPSEGECQPDQNRLPFQVNWQAKIAENECCAFTERTLKQSYKLNGGCASYTGEGSMDGTGTTLGSHGLFKLASELKILGNGNTVTDLGSGTGVFLTHLALFDGCKCIGVEIIDARVERSILQLRLLEANFNQTNVYFCRGDILDLKTLSTDVVYAFNKEFPTDVQMYIVALLTAPNCVVKYAILFEGIDLEADSIDSATKWEAMRDDTGKRIVYKMPLMISKHVYQCHFYRRMTVLQEGTCATTDSMLRTAWGLVNDPVARRVAVDVVYKTHIDVITSPGRCESTREDDCENSSSDADDESYDSISEAEEEDYEQTHNKVATTTTKTLDLECKTCKLVWTVVRANYNEPLSGRECKACEGTKHSAGTSKAHSLVTTMSTRVKKDDTSGTSANDDVMTFFKGQGKVRFLVHESHVCDDTKDPIGTALTQPITAYFLNPKSRIVSSKEGLRAMANFTQVSKSNGCFTSGVSIDSVDFLCPISIKRIAGSCYPLDQFKCLPRKWFDEYGIAYVAGFRVSSDKRVQPLCIEFDEVTGRAIGVGAMVSTASAFVENIRVKGDHRHLEVSHDIPEEMLLFMVSHLTSDFGIFKGISCCEYVTLLKSILYYLKILSYNVLFILNGRWVTICASNAGASYGKN